MKRILVVDNQLSIRELLNKFLSKNSFEVETVCAGLPAITLIQRNKFDFIISEYRLPDMDGREFFDKIKAVLPSVQIIFMTREINLKNAVDIIKRGASQYLAKPLNPDELLEILKGGGKSEEENHGINLESKPQISISSPSSSDDSQIVYGKSSKAKWMIRQVEKVAVTNFTVLIEGETGTGKESLARLIHQQSMRKDGPFVPVDCGSLSREIAGSELFGHEKGAFTGALNSKIGFFEQADGGTIFLDEIANLPMEIQISLLRVLQEKVIRRVGGTKEIPIDVRIIAATNEELLGKTQNLGFREDLLFRLNEFVLKVPNLRERMDDFPLFIDFFLDQTSKELGKDKPTLAEGVMDYFSAYPWPGNIRELRNVVRRSCLFLNKNNEIGVDSLPHRILINRTLFPCSESSRTINNTLQNHPQNDTEDLKSIAIRAESQRIMEVLKDVQFNKTKAAEVLNIHRKTLYSKLKMMNNAQ
jgi:two-component system, NtrC family, response regulator HydG